MNVQSINNKFPELRAEFVAKNFQIIGLNETWVEFQHKNYEEEYSLPGFELYIANRQRPTYRGGGSILYVDKKLKPELKTIEVGTHFEAIIVEVSNNANEKSKIIFVYRNTHIPQIQDQQLFQILDNEVNNNRIPTCVFGDFNVANIDWETMLGRGRHLGRNLIQYIEDNNLFQHIREPTRGRNILDLLITTEQDLITHLEVSPNVAGSDHNAITFVLEMGEPEQEINVRLPNFREADWEQLKMRLQNDNLIQRFMHNDANMCYDELHTRIILHQTATIPFRNKRKEGEGLKPRWYTNEIENQIKERDRIYKRWKNTGNEDLHLAHLRCCRNVKRMVRRAKRQTEIMVARDAKVNQKRFYQYVNERRKVRPAIRTLTDGMGGSATSDVQKAAILNDYFASIFTIENPIVPQPTDPPSLVELTDLEFNEIEVETYLKNLKTNKSPGADKLHPQILRALKNELKIPLTHIYNLSMQTGIVPEKFKEANITAIYKNKDKKLPQNYRPISLTSILGKTMERIIRDQIVEFLEENNYIQDSQHGFRRKRSCLTNLLDFFNEVITIYDNQRAVDIIYLDFSKAFDTVPHQRLIKKVENIGIRGNLLRWIKNWLNGRKQRVVVNGQSSEWKLVTSGVPQGSVLGPLLFIIYINDLENGLLSKISKYADDTKLCARANNEDDRIQLQSDIDKLVEWSEVWQMDFNVAKCKVIHVGRRNQNHNYTMGAMNMAVSREEKDLGVYIKSDLKHDTQIKHSIRKANMALGLISRNFEYKSKDIILSLYKSLVRPHLEYAVAFWSPYYRGDIDKIERVQRRATKMIPELRNRSYEERLIALGLTTLEKRRLKVQLTETYKYLNGYTTANSARLFERDQNQRLRNNGQKLVNRRFTTTVAQQFFPIKITTVWNQLPENVVESNTVKTFKARLDKYWETQQNQNL